MPAHLDGFPTLVDTLVIPRISPMTAMNAELHVVSVQADRLPLAERLLAGELVRIAKRSNSHVPAGCEVVCGDAADRGFCR